MSVPLNLVTSMSNPMKRSSSQSQSSEPEEDVRPHLQNLSVNSILKQEKITITGDEFIIGRSLDVSLNIPDHFVSRKHCLLKKESAEDSQNSESAWFLHHLGSSNTFVNARCVNHDEKVKLNTGDIIEFGDNRVHIFKFFAPDLELERKRAKRLLEEEKEKIEINLSEKLMASELEQKKMMKEKEELELKMQERIKMLEEQYQKEKEELEKKIENENLEKQKLAEERALIEEKLAQEKLLAEEKFNNEKGQLEGKLKGLEDTVKKIEEEKIRKEEERQLLEAEAEKIKVTLAEKEAALKEAVEQLKKDGEFEEIIKRKTEEYNRVQEALADNQDKRFLLEKQLEDTAGSSYLAAKTDVIETFSEVLESELQCSICNELYVEAMTLNCMHTFCAYCLDKWKKRKKECPVCRAKIKTENRAFNWDSFIEKMVSKLSDDLQQRRRELIAERNGTSSTSSAPITTPTVIARNGGVYQVVNAAGTPRIVNGQTIRVAVPVTTASAINPALLRGPTVRVPHLPPNVRMLGSIDLTHGRVSSPSSSRTPTTSRTPTNTHVPGRSTPPNPHRTSSSSNSDNSRRSSRFKDRQQNRPQTATTVREVVNLDESLADPSSTRPERMIDNTVIEISSDSDDDNVRPVHRKYTPVANSLQLSMPGSSSTPSTSGSSTSSSRTSKRKRSARNSPRTARSSTVSSTSRKSVSGSNSSFSRALKRSSCTLS